MSKKNIEQITNQALIYLFGITAVIRYIQLIMQGKYLEFIISYLVVGLIIYCSIKLLFKPTKDDKVYNKIILLWLPKIFTDKV